MKSDKTLSLSTCHSSLITHLMKHIALLRGVNVGGNTKLNMADLRATCERLGLENVKTYINSGNVAFKSEDADTDRLASQIHDAILDDFRLDVSVMVRSIDEMQLIVANNPFNGQFDNHKNMHVFFLADELPDEKLRLLLEKNCEAEKIAVKGRTVYCLLNISILESALGKGFLDKKLKVPATARNWRTVTSLSKM